MNISILNQFNLKGALELFQAGSSRAIVRPTGGARTSGVAGFVFDIVGREEANLTSDITDHYIEDNTAIEDHIALRPIVFSLRGFVGELNNVLPAALIQLYSAARAIDLVEGFSPVFATQPRETYVAIEQAAVALNNSVGDASNQFGVFQNASTTATKQQAAYNYFENLWATRQIVSVETPYGIFENMAIDSVRALQPDETLTVSDFAVTLKQIRVVQSIVSTDLNRALGRVANIVSDVAANGRAIGKQVPNSQLSVDFTTQVVGQ